MVETRETRKLGARHRFTRPLHPPHPTTLIRASLLYGTSRDTAMTRQLPFCHVKGRPGLGTGFAEVPPVFMMCSVYLSGIIPP